MNYSTFFLTGENEELQRNNISIAIKCLKLHLFGCFFHQNFDFDFKFWPRIRFIDRQRVLRITSCRHNFHLSYSIRSCIRLRCNMGGMRLVHLGWRKSRLFSFSKFTIFNKLISIVFQTILPSAGVALNVMPRNSTATKMKNNLKFILIRFITPPII